MKVCDNTCIFCFFPVINKYLCMAKRSLLSRCPSYKCNCDHRSLVLEHEHPSFFVARGPTRYAGLVRGCGKIQCGIPNSRDYRVIFIPHTKFTDVLAGRVLGNSGLRSLLIHTARRSPTP